MNFSVATWNINSIRLRIDLVLRYLAEHKPDVLCLQETKCPDDKFPHKRFARLGDRDGRHIALENSSLLGSDLYDRVAEKIAVIE